jgi:hypothetical protein
MLPAFRVFLGRALFVRGGDASIFFSGPAEAEEGTSVLSRWAGSSGISWRILTLVKKTQHRYRAGFEPQRASPFMKRVIERRKPPPNPPDARRSRPSLNDDPSLCATHYTVCGLVSSTSGNQNLWEVVTLYRPPPHQVEDERERLVTASPVTTKNWSPSWGK